MAGRRRRQGELQETPAGQVVESRSPGLEQRGIPQGQGHPTQVQHQKQHQQKAGGGERQPGSGTHRGAVQLCDHLRHVLEVIVLLPGPSWDSRGRLQLDPAQRQQRVENLEELHIRGGASYPVHARPRDKTGITGVSMAPNRLVAFARLEGGTRKWKGPQGLKFFTQTLPLKVQLSSLL